VRLVDDCSGAQLSIVREQHNAPANQEYSDHNNWHDQLEENEWIVIDLVEDSGNP
jgi:hypothetical protein